MAGTACIRWFDSLGSKDISTAGGKNASLGEMTRALKSKGINVPDGFALTTQAYWEFLSANKLVERINRSLTSLDNSSDSLIHVGTAIRRMILNAEFPADTEEAIRQAYRELSSRYDHNEVDVAVRSSATAEDLPDASFAGQQETFLNVVGENELLAACRRCYASLFTNRAIAYRRERGFDHMAVALSVGVQKMVRSDRAGSGVMFTLDTETGFPRVVLINAAWGLGETIVQGLVNPDEYMVYKPLLSRPDCKPIIKKTLGTKQSKMVYGFGTRGPVRSVTTRQVERDSFVLSDEEILKLARWAVAIEDHYQHPADIEWAKDGASKELFIVQARPETVHARKDGASLRSYKLKQTGTALVSGVAVGEAIASGKVCLMESVDQIRYFRDGSILVTGMTDPDWVPVMKRAAGIVTDQGGRTCHAAIVSRELGVPAIVGTGNATAVLTDGREVTLSCCEGEDGVVYDGILKYETSEVDISSVPRTRTRVMMNIGSPAVAFRWWRLPVNGIGLARMEFIISNTIKVHPMALVRFEELADPAARQEIQKLTRGYADRTEYFVDHLSRGIARIAASQHPEPVIVRMSDFKTNEYAELIGGRQFEPKEANPMIGFRGAARYYSPQYRDGFALECRAIRKVREEMGLDNVIVMIPFCRNIEEADRVLEVMAENGLERGKHGLEVYVMCEIPSNVILADQFCRRFDGFSVGSNDLTQLVLGIDRDSAELSHLFDERNEAIKRAISALITTAHKAGCKVGICGQAPSDHPDFAAFLVQAGIDSISLTPDSVFTVKHHIAEAESKPAPRRKAAKVRRGIRAAGTALPDEPN